MNVLAQRQRVLPQLAADRLPQQSVTGQLELRVRVERAREEVRGGELVYARFSEPLALDDQIPPAAQPPRVDLQGGPDR